MSGTILLADDSLTIQKVVELTFADTGHEVVSVSSGDDLLARLPSVQPDLVICDVLMPGTDGYSVCQTIKSDPRWLHIPVVLLTGTFEPFDRDRAIAAGCDEIITKPFEARKLVETVERLLSGGEGVPEEQTAPDLGEFEGAMAPPPEPSFTPTTPEQYETALSEPPAEPAQPAPAFEVPQGEVPSTAEAEELDFTTSGFDEMRRAGAEEDVLPEAPPDEGLEFDTGSPAQPMTPEEPFQPAPVSGEPFAAPPAFEEAEPTTPVPEDTFEFGSPENASTPASPEDAFSTPVQTPTMPMDVPEELRAHPSAVDESTDMMVEHPETTPSPTDTGPFGSPTDFQPAQPSEAEEPVPEESGESFDSPSTEPVVVPEASQPEVAAVEASGEPELTPAAPEPAPTPAEAGRLSDEDVERIARRVVELAADQLEQIAWEVLPDMAELVVRERIRQLEAEVEQESTTH